MPDRNPTVVKNRIVDSALLTSSKSLVVTESKPGLDHIQLYRTCYHVSNMSWSLSYKEILAQ
jgi:hypothetical protein